jgi:isocitrate dehydrogenase
MQTSYGVSAAFIDSVVFLANRHNLNDMYFGINWQQGQLKGYHSVNKLILTIG